MPLRLESSDMQYEIEVFGHEQRAAFRVAFAKSSKSVDPAVQARREWWCFDNPRGGAFAVAKAGDDIVATCYLGGKTLAQNGINVAGFEIGETATDPDHQRKGLFSKLVNACVAHGRPSKHMLIYGTPNSQSTPGYAKLGFDIVESEASYLFLAVSIPYWIRIGAPKGLGWGVGLSHELSATDYIDRTLSFHRLNESSRAYLQWRLADNPARLRFFELKHDKGTFVCAVKIGQLGHHSVLVCSEYFLNGTRPALNVARKFLSRAIWAHYDRRDFLGIYFHASNQSNRLAKWLRLQGVIAHRQLPVCAMTIDGFDSHVDWFKQFQLSDCDIG